MNRYLTGIFLASFSSVMFGLNPLFVSNLQLSNMNVYWTLIVRFGGSFLFFFSIVNFKRIDYKIDKDVIIKVFLSGLFFLLTSVFLVYSYTRIASGLTTVIHFFYPIIITLMSIQAKREKFSIALAVSIILSLIGVYLVTDPSHLEFDMLGVTSALLSAVTISIYLFLVNDEKVKKIDNTVFMVYVNLFGIIILLITALFIPNHFLQINKIIISPNTFFGIFGYIIASALGAYYYAYGAKIVGGPIAGTIGAFEPLTAVLVGILYLNEQCTNLYVLGVVLIITSTIVTSLFSNKKNIS